MIETETKTIMVIYQTSRRRGELQDETVTRCNSEIAIPDKAAMYKTMR